MPSKPQQKIKRTKRNTKSSARSLNLSDIWNKLWGKKGSKKKPRRAQKRTRTAAPRKTSRKQKLLNPWNRLSARMRLALQGLIALSLAGSAVLLISLTSEGPFSRICADQLLRWDDYDSISIGFSHFEVGQPGTREISFFPNGSWVLRYEEPALIYTDAACTQSKKAALIQGYRFEPDRGENGTLYEWLERPTPHLCTSRDGQKHTEYIAVKENWYIEKSPRRQACLREAAPLDPLRSLFGLL